METIKRLILENRAWAKGHFEIDPEYFKKMAADQKPEILWIGCADSRVPPDEIINTKPGTLFVHRNIANQVFHHDENLLSVLEYAVKYLKVKYIIVCGHYNCGGVKAAFEGIDNPRLSNWMRNISQLKAEKMPKDFNELSEHSVRAQIENLKKIPVIQEAWLQGEYPKLIGWMYDIKNGNVIELATYCPSIQDTKSTIASHIHTTPTEAKRP
jgi:carbonic anhydrase